MSDYLVYIPKVLEKPLEAYDVKVISAVALPGTAGKRIYEGKIEISLDPGPVSPILVQASLSGSYFAKMEIHYLTSASTTPYRRLLLETVYVTGFSMPGFSSDKPATRFDLTSNYIQSIES